MGRQALLYVGNTKTPVGEAEFRATVPVWTHEPLETWTSPAAPVLEASFTTKLQDADGPVTFKGVPERMTLVRSRNFRRTRISGRAHLTGPAWARVFEQRFTFTTTENTRRPRREARRARKRRQR